MLQPQTLLLDETRRCQVTYQTNFLTPKEADQLLATLQQDAPFVRESPVVFGKTHTITRASCAFGDAGVSYHYAGVTRQALRWPDEVRALKEKIEAQIKALFNFVLCNLYPDGASSLGWHSDDERDLSPGACIASISLGAERDFYIRHRDTHEVAVKVNLAHGSLLTMEGQTQRFYQHQVPKRAKCKEPRINLTFRKMLVSRL